jgi:hypothetical protein
MLLPARSSNKTCAGHLPLFFPPPSFSFSPFFFFFFSRLFFDGTFKLWLSVARAPGALLFFLRGRSWTSTCISRFNISQLYRK